ncbi:MAG: DnaJ domain-containing protein [Myxococcota bacterium]|jgi:DnaJ-class molecular chaperone|nr:DnaJ domain-containing protein [Myxococcota bacterium]
MTRDPKFDDTVLKIHGVLDKLDYYRLLGVDRSAGVADVKKAFYAIAAKFHPDRNRAADPKVQEALYDIFKRLNEAYRVLSESAKRHAYDEGLAEGTLRLSNESRLASVPKTPEETIKSREARQFYMQAEGALQKNNLLQAELHLKLAKAREPGNKAIEELGAKIAAAKSAPKKA